MRARAGDHTTTPRLVVRACPAVVLTSAAASLLATLLLALLLAALLAELALDLVEEIHDCWWLVVVV